MAAEILSTLPWAGEPASFATAGATVMSDDDGDEVQFSSLAARIPSGSGKDGDGVQPDSNAELGMAQGANAFANTDATSVRVAVRVRPLLPRENTARCRDCITYVEPGSGEEFCQQLVVGQGRSFSYDYVFSTRDSQDSLYKAVEPLVASFFEGYNATVLAYGQTGSGKTYTMGSAHATHLDASQLGVIPRVVQTIFAEMARRSEATVFQASVSFLEIHNENLIDLLDPSLGSKPSNLAIRDTDGQITIAGMTELQVVSADDALNQLETGSTSRTTAATLMNSESSRSHAIFTLTLSQTSKTGAQLVSKFHFVDLAGSERLKRTQAEGDRMKEGININCGLLALGNVISALGDPKRKAKHVPYRDSKLTRLLQDSLGGNSRTLMIACVSPADVNFEETLNTLRYADRARRIKNKPIINMDLSSAELSALRAHIQQLQTELAAAKAGNGALGGGGSAADDVLRLELENRCLNEAYSKAQAKLVSLGAALLTAQTERDVFKLEIERLGGRVPLVSEALVHAAFKSPVKLGAGAASVSNENADPNAHQAAASVGLVAGYVKTIAALQDKLDAAESQLREAKLLAYLDDPAGGNGNGNGNGNNNASRATPTSALSCAGGQSSAGEAAGEPAASGNGPAGALEQQDDDPMLRVQLDALVAEEQGSESTFQATQQRIDAQVSSLDRNIALKEELLARIVESKKQFNEMKLEYEAKLSTLEAAIAAIEADRDATRRELAELESGSKQGSSRARREYELRLKALNEQLHSLQTNKSELERLQKLRAKEHDRIAELEASIEEMKKNRIALLRKQRDDAKEHAAWRSSVSRKIAQLQAQQRKDHAKIKRQEVRLEQQKTVARRKIEELSLAKKRIRESTADRAVSGALAKQSNAAKRPGTAGARLASDVDSKPAWGQALVTGIPKNVKAKLDGIRTLFSKQLELHVARAQAKAALEAELARREAVVEQLGTVNATRASLLARLAACESGTGTGTGAAVDAGHAEQALASADPTAMAAAASGEARAIHDELAGLADEAETLEAKLAYQSSLIAEAQRAMLETAFQASSELADFADELDERLIRRVDHLNAHECKAALFHCFALAVSLTVQADRDRLALSELRDSLAEREHLLADLTHAAQEAESQATARQSEYEDKLLFLLEKINTGSTDYRGMPGASNDPPTTDADGAGEGREAAQLRAQLHLVSTQLQVVMAKSDKYKAVIAQHKQHVEDLLATSQYRRLVLQQVQMENVKLQARIAELTGAAASLAAQAAPMGAFLASGSSDEACTEAPAAAAMMTTTPHAAAAAAATAAATGSALTPGAPALGMTCTNDGMRTAPLLVSGAATAPAVPLAPVPASAPARSTASTAAADDLGQNACVMVFGGGAGPAGGHAGHVYDCVAAEDMGALFTVSQDKTVKTWDAERGTVLSSLDGHTAAVLRIARDASSNVLFTGSKDKSVRLWDPSVRSGSACMAEIKCNSEVLEVTVDGYTVYAALDNGFIRRWDTRKLSLAAQAQWALPRIRGRSGSVFSLAVATNDFLVAGYRDHHVALFDLAAENVETGLAVPPVVTLQPPHYDGVSALCLHGGLLFSGSKHSDIKQWTGVPAFRTEAGLGAISSTQIGGHRAAVMDMMVADGILHSVAKDGTVQFWDIEAKESAGQIGAAHADAINAIVPFTAGHFLTASNDRTVKLWSISFV